MKDTVALHMLGDPFKAAEALFNAEAEFNNAQKRTEVAEGVMQALQRNHASQITMFWDEGSLSDTEKVYVDSLIEKGITEFELRQIDSEVSMLLEWRSPDILSHTITKEDGTLVETIVEMSMILETFEMKISPFSLENFAMKQDTYNAIEKYLRSKMEQLWYKYVLKTSSFPGTLRFGKEPFQYVEQCAKVETHPTAEYYALLWIVR
jgi:hypothetical protein